MTVLQMAIAAGCLAGLGVALIVWRLVPADPHLMTALERLAPDRSAVAVSVAGTGKGMQDRMGMWVQRNVPLPSWIRVPTRELALLRVPVHRYFGEKALYFVIGLVFPPLMGVMIALVGLRPPFTITVAGSLILAVLLSFIPDYNARTDAATARQEFTRALGAYIDLVALERAGGAGSTQALETAAEVGDSWVFRRLREELARARWSGTPPWDSLGLLADELGLPELSDLSDIMRLSGEEGATVYATLRARSAGLRTALLTDEHSKANAAAEKMTMPVAVLSLIFLVLLATPAILRVALGGQ